MFENDKERTDIVARKAVLDLDFPFRHKRNFLVQLLASNIFFKPRIRHFAPPKMMFPRKLADAAISIFQLAQRSKLVEARLPSVFMLSQCLLYCCVTKLADMDHFLLGNNKYSRPVPLLGG